MRSFLAGEIGFLDIVAVVEETLARLPAAAPRSLADVHGVDAEARQIADMVRLGRRA